MIPSIRTVISTTACAITLCGAHAAHAQQAKNVILMIADGWGFNAVTATDYYRGAPAVYESFTYQYGMQTTSANNLAGYDPAQFWANAGYNNSDVTDSASSATAMYTGQKIFNGRINITTNGDPITTFFEKAAQMGMSIGAVSSVELSHATPAAVYAHNTSRGNYATIAYEGIYGANPVDNLPNNGSDPQAGDNNNYDALNYHGNMTVLMGAGHGDYDNSGNIDFNRTNRYVGGDAAWADIIDGAPPNGWTYVEQKAVFEEIAAGNNVPAKLLGIAQANQTLQYNRSGTPADPANPSGAAFNTNVPTLETMTRAALNVLAQNDDGFAVMIESGAVDWAGHNNDLARQIEEHMDFDASVQAVVDWVNLNDPTWSETLVIVTGDHETGDLWGPGGDFDLITDNGVGVLPSHSWQSGSHTNSLIPFYAQGTGAAKFNDMVIGVDANMVTGYGLVGTGFDGSYIDNTSIYHTMMMTAIPEPTSLLLMSLGVLVLLRFRAT